MKILAAISIVGILAVSSVTAASSKPTNEEPTSTTARPEAESPDDKVKCRRLTVTGSLVKREKVCRTIAQWRELSQAGGRNARELVDASNQGMTNGK